ncbi:MAG: serine hydrolase domain-containing protein [Spirosomataceae bacterium]
MMRKLFLSVLGLLWTTLVLAQLPDSLQTRLEQYLSTYDHPNEPGFALLISQRGQVVYRKAVGYANLEHGIRNITQSVYSVASVSKQFTAAAVAMLQLEGKIDVEASIRTYFPELPEGLQTVKVRHLIHHQSGLREIRVWSFLAGYYSDIYNMTEGETLEWVCRQQKPYFEPGSQYDYSNTNYFLMSLLVQRVSGKNLRVFCEERIFKPLGMAHSHLHNDVTEIVPLRATGYYKDEKGTFHIDPEAQLYSLVGPGRLFTSVEDLAIWDDNFNTGKVGGKPFLDLIQTPGKFNADKTGEYAYGLSISTFKGQRTVEHSGANTGYNANFMRFPDKGFTLICISNSGHLSPVNITRNVAEIMLTGRIETTPAVAPTPKPPYVPKNSELASLSGNYYSAELQMMYQAFVKDGKLFVQYKPYKPIFENALSPVSKDVFTANGYVLTFVRDEQGKVTHFNLGGGRMGVMRFDKQ